jgi:putative flippase GtrA
MGREFLKFLTVSLAGLVLNELAFWVFRARLDLHVMLSQLLAIACVLPFNFVVNKLWSFRGQ